MRRFATAAALLLLVTACGGGGSDSTATQTPPPLPPPAPSASELLAEDLQGLSLPDFYAVSFEALLYRSPESIVWNALEGTYPLDSAGLDDLSDSYVRETYAMVDVILDAMQNYDRSALNESDQRTYDFYQWYLQDRYDELAFINYNFAATYNFHGIQSRTQRFFADLHPLQSEQDALNYISRLNQVQRKFGDVSDYLGRQSAAGIVEPLLTLNVAIGGLGAIADGDVFSNPYFTAFETQSQPDQWHQCRTTRRTD